MTLKVLRLFSNFMSLFWLIAWGALSLGVSFAQAAEGVTTTTDQVRIFRWNEWQKGFDLGPRMLGHFGKGESLNSPPGGILIQGSFHTWYRHLVEGHATLGFGISNSTFVYGVGFKFNLLEILNDPTGETQARGISRGLLNRLAPDLMLFASLDFLHFGFPKPDLSIGQSYEASSWSFQPGAGIQFYAGAPFMWTRKTYVETSLYYTGASGNKFLSLYLGLGFELKN